MRLRPKKGTTYRDATIEARMQQQEGENPEDNRDDEEGQGGGGNGGEEDWKDDKDGGREGSGQRQRLGGLKT